MRKFLSILTLTIPVCLQAHEQYRPLNDLIQSIVKEASAKEIDPKLALAIVQTESGFVVNTKRHEPKLQSYSVGLFQVLMTTAQSLGFKGTLQQLMIPKVNIRYGITYLKSCQDTFGDNINLIACCYNAGTAVKESVCRNNRNVKEYIDLVVENYNRWGNLSTNVAEL